MKGTAIADKLKALLEDLSGWTGVIYTYIPNVKTDKQYLEALVDSDTDRVDVWFVRRSSISTAKYGNAPRDTPQGYRVKSHSFIIRGFQSVYDIKEVLNATSETEFQDRCDDIEAELAKDITLDVTNHTLVTSNISMDIDYDMLGKALCHSVTITFDVNEYLRTYYE